MLILVSGATTTVRKHIGNAHLGQLITPHSGNALISELPFAADNAAYSNWSETAFLRMLDKLAGTAPKFVTVPDYVGNARITAQLFNRWAPEIQERGLPVGYVLQDGQSVHAIPWDAIDAIFIGGSTTFKSDDHVRWCVYKAKSKGKWTHMGRVNSLQRLQLAFEMGIDSVDGTGYSRFAELKLAKSLRYLEQAQVGFGFEELRFAA